MKTLKSNQLLLAVSLFLTLMISGCNKDEGLTSTELLARQWNVYTINEQLVHDYMGFDSYTLTFKTDGSLVMSIKVENILLSSTYNWSWQNNESSIVMSDGTDSFEWTVQKLTEEEFWFTDTDEMEMIKCLSN